MEQTLGKRIVTHRKRLSLTQDQLAEKLGVTAQAVSKWENDQSCPDISILPQLADIFEITTDALLGREAQHTVQGAGEAKPAVERPTYNIKKHGSIGLATCILLVGTVYLASSLFGLGLSLWDALWPSALLIFGTFSLWPRFSFMSLASALLGGYVLISKLLHVYLQIPGSIILSILILLFGISLMADIFMRKWPPVKHLDFGSDHTKCEFSIDNNCFCYTCSFGENNKRIDLATLETGNISVNFGDFTVDLSGVASASDGCRVDVCCHFGELKLLIPRRFRIIHDSSTAFAGFRVTGAPFDSANESIQINAKVRFGEIKIIYV